ncbi:hypothetical protein ACPB67_23955 [Micromonospora taraxaci]|uniref:hypothetical protein n=1 Tax=Micromonospora taraxaci TaxID=1316803 RepID=UPI003C2D2E49
MAYREDPTALEGVDLIAIEAQAIDLRGGSVAPAWRAWEDGVPDQWRRYFTDEAERNEREDKIAYGINTGNVHKRLGTQVVAKGEFLRQIQVPLYVVTQHRILQQLRERVDFDVVREGEPWDITFVSFEYDGTTQPNGQLAFSFREAVRTTHLQYLHALTTSRNALQFVRSDFIAKVREKAAK